MTDLNESIAAFLRKNYNLMPADVSLQSPLFSSGLLDSFAMVELVSFVESEAGVKVRARDVTLDNFDSIERISRFLGNAGT